MLPGGIYNRLTCIESLPKARARFRCICGTIITRRERDVRSGHTNSCGCLRDQILSDARRTHGLSKHDLYATWVNIIQRCTNQNHPRYKDWGGRGIRICKEWRESFPAFLLYVGERPFNTSIDRIDNDGNYEPGNIRWATAAQQRQNQYRLPWPFGVLTEEKDGYEQESTPELRNPPADGGPLEMN